MMTMLVSCLAFSVLMISYSLYRTVTGNDELKFSEPFCGKCRSDLRAGWDGSMHCHQCGQSLTEPFAVYFGKNKKPYTRWGMVRKTLYIILVFALFYAMPYWLYLLGMNKDKAQAVGYMSSTKLIATLPKNMDGMWHWKELERRYNNGKLTDEQVQQCVRKLIEALDVKGSNVVGRMNWSGTWMSNLILAGKLPDKLTIELLQAYYGQPQVTAFVDKNGEPSDLLTFKIPNSTPMDWTGAIDPHAYLLKITEADQDLPLRRIQDFGKREYPTDQPLYIGLNPGSGGKIARKLSPGEHTLVFTYQVSYYPGKIFKAEPPDNAVPRYTYTVVERKLAVVNERGAMVLHDLPEQAAVKEGDPKQ